MNNDEFKKEFLEQIKSISRQTFEVLLDEIKINTIEKENVIDYDLDVPEQIREVINISIKNINKLLKAYDEFKMKEN